MSESQIHVLVYRNVAGMGYTFSNYTDNFPQKYTAKIRNIASSIVEEADIPSRMLRYAPLDNDFFLLSIIDSEYVGNRSTWKMVHFLMNEVAASVFFHQPFRAALQSVHDYITEFLPPPSEPHISQLPSHIFSIRKSHLEGVCEPALLDAAIHNYKNVSLYCGEDTPEEYFEKRLAFIPLYLRHKLSFMINAPDRLKDKDINIFIRMGTRVTPARTSLDHLSRIPEKIPLYDHLQFCITNWYHFQALGDLVKAHNVSLKNVLKLLPNEGVAKYIKAPNIDFSEDELRDLYYAASRKSPIRKVIKETQSYLIDAQRQKPNNSHHAPIQTQQTLPKHPSRTTYRKKSDLSLLLFLLFTAVFFMTTVLLLMGADSNWSLLSLPTGPAAGYYLFRLASKRKRH